MCSLTTIQPRATSHSTTAKHPLRLRGRLRGQSHLRPSAPFDVDNAPPTVAFTTAQDPNDPELIRAPAADATSGISSGQIFYRPVGQTSWRPLDTRLQSGELRARIDSTIEPPGDYEFMAQASDVAGNSAQTTIAG